MGKGYRQDIYSACRDICGTYAGNILFRHGSETITFAEAETAVRKRAVMLQNKGYGKGDVVAILSANSPEWCISFLAITAIGGVALPLDTGLNGDNYREMLSSAGARAVFVSDALKDRVGPTPSLEIRFSDSGTVNTDETSFSPLEISCESVAAMLFTSGTTGTPKIVTLTHSNLLHIACVCTDLEEYTEKDVTLAMLPFFHVYALEATFLAPFVTGSSIILQNSLKGPDIMKTLAENPVTIFPAAPLMWELFFDGLANRVRSESKARYRLFMFFVNNAPLLKMFGLNFLVKKIFAPVHDAFGHSHRFFISGGAPLKKEYFTYYKNMGFNIMEGYGLSETTGPIAIPYYKKSKAGSVGAPIRGNEVSVRNINEDGIGEIWLKGDAVMPGYFRNDQLNRSVFDDKGFFNTGDLGRVDRHGNIYITGRMKNVIVLDSGKKVYPEELEFYFRQSDIIREIAVFDRVIEGKSVVYAVIVPALKMENAYMEIQHVVTELNRHLPEYKRIRRFAISLDELPKNSTRKLLYGEIRALVEEGVYQEDENDSVVLRDILKGASVREDRIIHCLKEKLGADVLYRNETLQDYDVDSMKLIGLIVHLEQNLYIQIAADAMRTDQNLGDILLFLSSLGETSGQSLDQRILEGRITTRLYPFFNPFHHMVLSVFSFISRMLWNVSVINPENFDLKNTIVISNHQSYLDMVWIAFSIPRSERKNVYVTGKRKLSFLSYIFPVLPVIYVDDDNTIDVLKAGADILRMGKTLIIFPEGTRCEDGELHPFQNGASYLAMNLKKKVIPVSVKGAYEIWPRHRKFPEIFTDKKGILYIGDCIDPVQYDTIESLNSAMEKAIQKGITALT